MTEPLERVPISKRLVAINSLSSVATRILSIGVFAWIIRHLIDRAAEEDLALLFVVWAITMALPLLQSVLTAGLGRYITEAYASNDLARVTQITSSVFPFLVLSSMVIAVLSGLAIWKIDALMSIPPEQVDTMRLMLIFVVGRLLIGFCLAPFTTGFFVKQKFVLQNLLQVSGSMLRIVLMIALIFGLGPRVEWVILAQVAAHLWILLASTVISKRLLPELRVRLDQFDVGTALELANYGSWSSVGQLAATIRRAADPPILHVLATPLAVNNFFYGAFIDTQLRQLHMAGSQVLLPALTALHARGEKYRLAAAFLRQGRLSLWVVLLVATPLLLFRTELFRLYLGSNFEQHRDAPTVLALLICCYPFTYALAMLGPAAQAMGEMGPFARRAIMIQMVNLALTLLLVGQFSLGAVGAALSTFLVASVLAPAAYYPMAIRLLGMNAWELVRMTLIPGLLPATVAFAAGLALRSSLAPQSLTGVSLAILTVMSVYVFVMWFCLTPVDRRDLAIVRRLAS